MRSERVVVPGDLICSSDASRKSGLSTYVCSGNILSSAFGFVKEESHADGTKTYSVDPLKPAGIVPNIGSLVLAKVSSITWRFVRCDIVAVGDTCLAGPFKGLIRREDIRATQRDQAEPADCFRPGDIVRARVINLLGPGAYANAGSIMSSTSSQTLSTLLSTQALSCSLAATSDANLGGSNSVCLLSTAEPNLGVVLGLGRSPENNLLELLGSTSGSPLVPVGWTEMLCPQTLARYHRKVARVPDELAGVRTTELAAILCATFENVQGTVIAYQYPPNYVSPTQFKEIGNAVIPRAELAFRLVTIEAFKHYVIGCLQRIEGVQYKRNTLQFNICLVIKPRSTPDRDDISHWQFWDDQSAGGLRPNVQAAYEALTLKINRYFYSLEEQCAFLSRALGHHDGAVNSVNLPCLDSIYKQLHESGMCIISFPNCGSLYLRFSPRQDRGSYSNLSFDTSELVHEHITNSDTELKFDQKIRQINLHYNNQLVFPNFNPQTESEVTDDCVFVLIASPSYKCHSKLGYNMSGGWRPLDAVAQRILPYIDGKRRLMELAHLAQLDVTIARLCLIDLARIGVVRSLPYPTFLVPSLQVERFSNMNLIPGWLGLPRLATLLTDYNLSRICLETVVPRNHHPHKPNGLCIHDIFRLYTVLCASSNFSLPYLVSANPHIRFTEYPNCMNSSSSSSYYSLPPIQPSKFCPCYTFQFHKRHHRHCSKISLLSLVQFGEVNGLIRRIQCYPISDKLAIPDEQTSNHRLPSVASLSKESSSATSAVIITPNSSMNSTLRQIKTHSNSLRHNPSKFSKKPKIINEQMWSTAKSMLMDGQHSLDSIITFMVMNNDSSVESPPTVHKIPEHITEISQLYRFDECLSGQMPHNDHDISQINRSKLSNSFSFSPDDTIVNNNSQIVEEIIAHDRILDNRLWSKPEDCMTAFIGPLDLDKTHLTLPDLYWMWR